MTGIVRMPPEVQAKFIDILRLEETERREFERLVGLSAFDSTTIAARYAFDNFVFGQKMAAEATKIFKFAYHEGDTFLRTSEEIYALIEAVAFQPGATCAIRIVNCLSPEIFGSVSSFIDRILAASETATVEHLLAFSERDNLQNINTLTSIIPLLKYKNYSACYSTEFTYHDASVFFGNTLMIDINVGKASQRYFFLAFHGEELSDCLSSSDPSVYNFFTNNYKYFKAIYNTSLLDVSGVDVMANNMLELQQNADQYLLKPNFCYDDIPDSVYQSLLTRASEQELAAARSCLASSLEDDTVISALLAILAERRATTYHHRRINVHSMDGLRELAVTGRLTDHLAFMPSFNKQELRAIFEYVRDRNSDPKDSYTLFITREKVLVNWYIIFAFENIGALIEHNQESYAQGICAGLFVRNKMLAAILSDYMRNHIPDKHALSREEATAFLNTLIASLA